MITAEAAPINPNLRVRKKERTILKTIMNIVLNSKNLYPENLIMIFDEAIPSVDSNVAKHNKRQGVIDPLYASPYIQRIT